MKWTIRTRTLKITAIVICVFALGFLISSVEAKPQRVNLPTYVEKQFTVWLNGTASSEGLYDWLAANPGTDTDPIWYQARGEADLYQFLLDNNGSSINVPSDLTDRMLDAAEVVSRSYAENNDYTYEVSSTTVTRSDMHDFFNEVLEWGNRDPIVKAPMRLVKVPLYAEGCCTQYGIPIANGGKSSAFVEGVGDGDSDYFDELDEGFGAGRGTGTGPDDSATYWRTEDNPDNVFLETIVTDGTFEDPQTNSDHITRGRHRKDSSGGRQIDVELTAKSSAVPRAERSFVDIGSSWTTHQFTLTTSEAGNIGDYTSIEVQSNFITVGGGPPRQGYLSTQEFEFPDAPEPGEPTPTEGSYGWIY